MVPPASFRVDSIASRADPMPLDSNPAESPSPLAAYRTAVYSACAVALDEGIFYQEALEARVRELTDSLDPILNTFLGETAAPVVFADRRQTVAALEATIVQAPRGTWLAISSLGKLD